MKQISAAADRNKTFIFGALAPYLPHAARVLEIASGTGQHAAYIGEQRPDIVWQPSDIDATNLASIRAYREELELVSVLEPVAFNVMDDAPAAIAGPYDVLVNINMIHIAPWNACLSLLNWTAELLKTGGILYLYGPYLVNNQVTAASNMDFDRSLRVRNPEWGLRNLETVQAEALKRGLRHKATLPMPANNLSVIFEKL